MPNSSGLAKAWAGLASALCMLIAVPAPALAHQGVNPAFRALIGKRSGPRAPSGPDLVERGRRLFAEETFGGNGRTCATCHPPGHNFTLDPKFIAILPPRNPLFVAEYDPNLRDLEIPTLMRRSALILENLDGFDQPGVLRSVPHLFGLRHTMTPDPATNGTLVAATGWSGDGSPFDGSLRNFAVGAVVQHFTRTLARQPNRDFRLPTEDELDALEAYQLSLGSQAELESPQTTKLLDADADAGKTLFFSQLPIRNGATRTCSGCHTNAGGNNSAGLNQNRDTNASRDPRDSSCLAPGAVAGDGGFDRTQVSVESFAMICGFGSGDIVYRGTNLFNPPTLVEAADTPPFFHNNVAATIEDAVAFYTTDTFNAAKTAIGRGFVLDQVQIQRIAAYLRALNSIENVRSALAAIESTLAQPPRQRFRVMLLAAADTGDAIDDLTTGPISLFQQTGAVGSLREARLLLLAAAVGLEPTAWSRAQVALRRAQGQMVAP